MKTVLVLEDEPDVMEFLRDVLKQYTVIAATNAEQALGLFTGHGRQVDLLVSNVTLAKSSGIQIALILRSEIPDLPMTKRYSDSAYGDASRNDLADRIFKTLEANIAVCPFFGMANWAHGCHSNFTAMT